jgi:hypothetical protein
LQFAELLPVSFLFLRRRLMCLVAALEGGIDIPKAEPLTRLTIICLR